jgi:hypothetical protein
LIDDDEIEFSHEACPKCHGHTYSRQCHCDEGLSYHDCGDDCCVCVDPEPNVRCDECGGHGYQNWCPKCGYDLLLGRYFVKPELEPTAK